MIQRARSLLVAGSLALLAAAIVTAQTALGTIVALERFGGQPLDYRGYTCSPEPTVEGENRVWVGCLVTLAREGDEPTPIRLFSSILERNGRFAVPSYANDF